MKGATWVAPFIFVELLELLVGYESFPKSCFDEQLDSRWYRNTGFNAACIWFRCSRPDGINRGHEDFQFSCRGGTM